MSDATNFGKMVPGFDFLQSLIKNAGSAVPGMGQWIAPTLDPAELEKRIGELRTVHFWLEQNARMLGATIQALEVQRMTLATLQSMNLPVTEMAEAFKLRLPAADAPAARPAPAPAPEPEPAAAPTGVVDPLQWWGALTKQFGELAAGAMKDGPGDIALNMAKSVADTVASSVASTVAAGAAPKKSAATGAAKPAARKRAS